MLLFLSDLVWRDCQPCCMPAPSQQAHVTLVQQSNCFFAMFVVRLPFVTGDLQGAIPHNSNSAGRILKMCYLVLKHSARAAVCPSTVYIHLCVSKQLRHLSSFACACACVWIECFACLLELRLALSLDSLLPSLNGVVLTFTMMLCKPSRFAL